MNRFMPRVVFAALLAAVALSGAMPTAARAQSASLVLGFQHRNLDIDTKLVPELDPIGNQQTSLRATYTWDMNERFTVVAQGGVASSYLELTDARLTGLTDLRLRGLYRPSPEWAIGVGTIVPFGLYELSANEVTTAQWTWNPRSGFPLNAFGSGWGWEITAARAFAITPTFTAGLAAGVLRHAEFNFLDLEEAKYRLGSEGSLSLALQWDLDRGRRLRTRIAGKLFGADQLAGENFVEQGSQVEIGANLDTPVGSWFSSWGARVLAKGDNSIEVPATPGVADSVTQISQAPGTYLTLEGRLGRPVGESFQIYVEGTYTTISGSDYAVGANGNSTGFGPGFGWRVSPNLSLGGRFLILMGTGDADLEFDGQDFLITAEFRP
jgi:hypothetical protein